MSLGYDVLYFDLHHYFFQNPLRYLYDHTTAPLVTTGPAAVCAVPQLGADGALPTDHHRLVGTGD
jgi:hypothetical protein